MEKSLKYKISALLYQQCNKPFKRSEKKEEQYWEKQEYPKELNRIKSTFEWEEYPIDFKEKWVDYIEEEFNRREEGYWYYNNGIPNYITGTHYMYLQWSKIDVEQQTIGNQINYFTTSGKPVKRMTDVMECVILKTDDQDFHLWLRQNLLIKPQCLVIQDLGYYPNQVQMLRKCSRIKLYQSRLTIHSSSNPSKMVWIVLKPNWHIESRLLKLTRRKLDSGEN